MQILLSTDFKTGDIVEPVINDYVDTDEKMFYVVTGYEILGTDETGQVNKYLVIVQGRGSEILYFKPEALKND